MNKDADDDLWEVSEEYIINDMLHITRGTLTGRLRVGHAGTGDCLAPRYQVHTLSC